MIPRPSRNLLVGASVVAFLSMVARSLLDYQFVMASEFPRVYQAAIGVAIYTLLFAVWLVAIVAIDRGNRAGVVASFTVNALFWLAIPLGTLVAYCPSPCTTGWPLMEIVNWFGLVTGAATGTILAVGLGFRTTRPQTPRAA